MAPIRGEKRKSLKISCMPARSDRKRGMDHLRGNFFFACGVALVSFSLSLSLFLSSLVRESVSKNRDRVGDFCQGRNLTLFSNIQLYGSGHIKRGGNNRDQLKRVRPTGDISLRMCFISSIQIEFYQRTRWIFFQTSA